MRRYCPEGFFRTNIGLTECGYRKPCHFVFDWLVVIRLCCLELAMVAGVGENRRSCSPCTHRIMKCMTGGVPSWLRREGADGSFIASRKLVSWMSVWTRIVVSERLLMVWLGFP